MTPAIELRGVTKRFATPSGDVFTALADLDMTVAPGEFCAVVGPTGCGKSTTLTLVSGLERASTGSVRIDGRPVAGLTPGVGFVFQQDAAFPWKSVLDNVAAGPRFRGVRRRVADEAARDWLRRVGLSGFEDRYPHQLSGGMRKRVALAQSLINEPKVLLMDEPFSALDVQTRSIMSDELLSLWDLTRPSVVFVTHDLEEAIALADKVVVLTAGPGRVKGTFRVDLPRPRNAQEIRFTDEFLSLYHEIWEALRSEVETAYARTTAKASA
jgi:NitT/TauT family transport system ATP-binding protein